MHSHYSGRRHDGSSQAAIACWSALGNANLWLAPHEAFAAPYE